MLLIRTILIALAAVGTIALPVPQGDADQAVTVTAIVNVNVEVVTPAIVAAPVVAAVPVVVEIPDVAAGTTQSSQNAEASVAIDIISDATLPSTEVVSTEAVTETTTTEAVTPATSPEAVTQLVFFVPDVNQPAAPALNEWQKGGTYNVGDEVSWGGQRYKSLQKHSADAYNWTPPQAPALWAPV